MRILQVTPAYYPELQFGGPPQKIHALSTGLIRRGHEVRVITFHSEHPDARHRAEYDSVPVHYVPWLGRGTWQLPLGWKALQASVQWSDVAHCFGFYNLLCPAVAFLARRLERSYLVEPLGMYVPIVRSVLKKRLYHKILGDWLVSRAARLIATSAQEQSELLEAGVDPHKVAIRHNGIDLASFYQLPPQGNFRRCYGIGEHDKLVLYLGRLSPKKGLPLLLEAFARLDLPDAWLAIVGPDDGSGYEQEIHQLAIALGIARRVVFAGPLYNVHKLEAFADADVFVLPSLNENFGNAVAESVAAGVPVIISKQCGIAPFIRERVGLVIDVQAGALAEAMRNLLTDAALWQSFRAHCPAVAQELSWDEPLDVLEKIYAEVASLPRSLDRPG